ncbi:MAG: hemerythrin domain-containing protein [bacterium]
MIRLPDPNTYEDPIRYFRDSHALIILQINRLEKLVTQAETGDPIQSIQTDSGWVELLEFLVKVAPIHEKDEELALFPLVFKKLPHVGFQESGTPIRFIHEQHEIMQAHSIELLGFWKKMLEQGSMTQDEVSRFILGAKELVAIYREHIRRENEIIYVTANDELLTPFERAAIMKEIREHHSKQIITSVFDFEAPVFSDTSYKPVYVTEESEDAISEIVTGEDNLEDDDEVE